MLSLVQEAQIRALMCEKRPEQLKMEFALWICGAAMQLIEREYGLVMRIRTAGEYLKRWGFTPLLPSSAPTSSAPRLSRSGLTMNGQAQKTGRHVMAI